MARSSPATEGAGVQELALITLVVRDYDEAIAWFREVLDFELAEDTPLGDKRWVVVRPRGSDGTGILLARAADDGQRSRIGDQAAGRVFLFLHTDDLARDHSRISAAGVTIDSPRTESYGKVAVFRDLYGNRWDLIEPSASLTDD